MKQICKALSYLHAHKVIHRDIKLENIMLSDPTPNCSAKLADFGLAEVISEEESCSSHGSTAGTVGYAAPEIVAGRPYGSLEQLRNVRGVGATTLASLRPLLKI